MVRDPKPIQRGVIDPFVGGWGWLRKFKKNIFVNFFLIFFINNESGCEAPYLKYVGMAWG